MPESSEERILYLLKSRGPQTAAAVAKRLGITVVGARKHLQKLLDRKLVGFTERRESVGRPERSWSLTERGHARFPDSHSDLTLELLRSVRKVFGEAGLEKLIDEREQETLRSYGEALSACDDLAARVRALVKLRSREGYMAEWRRNRDGSFLLLENHCPICAAASECQGLCRSELAIFRAVLGKDVTVTRSEHILEGARRCAYRIAPRAAGSEDAADDAA